MNTLWLSALAILLYLLASAGFLRQLQYNLTINDQQPYRKQLLGLVFVAIILHTASLWPQLMTSQGLNLGFFNAISLVALLTMLIFFLSSLTLPVDILGIPLLSVAAVAVALNAFYPDQQRILSGNDWKLDLHILFSILAYSILGLGAAQASLLAIQERHLRNRRPGGFIRALPPLEIMESLLFEMISIGFILLSAALLTGILFIDNIFAQHLVHKSVLSFIAWGVFAILLWGRWKFGWRGRTAIRWTLTGFAFLLLAYFGSKFVLELILEKT
ncbi:MAG: cytochrome c biogenesis protein CcsA [Gammaproteobacteria bacterium]